jgi:hypothetical protein
MAKASYQDAAGAVCNSLLTSSLAGAAAWIISGYQAATPANGFQGAIFESNDEVICAYKRSKGGILDRTTTGFGDWSVNDVQIGLNFIPSQSVAAAAFARTAQRIAGNKPVSLVGHSLGGGLAQRRTLSPVSRLFSLGTTRS